MFLVKLENAMGTSIYLEIHIFLIKLSRNSYINLFICQKERIFQKAKIILE